MMIITLFERFVTEVPISLESKTGMQLIFEFQFICNACFKYILVFKHMQGNIKKNIYCKIVNDIETARHGNICLSCSC